jgi:hypothetical protein
MISVAQLLRQYKKPRIYHSKVRMERAARCYELCNGEYSVATRKLQDAQVD